MTDPDYRKQKARLTRFFRKWANCTGMGGWIVNHHWHRGGLETSSREDAAAGYVCQARTHVQWQYLTIDFHWNVRDSAALPDYVLDRVVRHEIAHALVNEMRELGRDSNQETRMAHEERVVTQLASVLLWCREAGKKERR